MNSEYETDYLIIGAGPAGLQIGYYLNQANRRYMILEAGGSSGTFFKLQPRHRQLLSINKVHTGIDDPELNLRWDWNSLLTEDHGSRFSAYDSDYYPHADNLVRYLQDFAVREALDIRFGVKIVRISRAETGFSAEDQEGNIYRCKWLIVATGLATPYAPSIPGIEHAEHYESVSVDPSDFVNQRILIIGKGNSAFETANSLISTAAVVHVASPGYITFAWDTHYAGHLRSINSAFIDSYLLKSQNAALEATVDVIRRRNQGYEVDFTYRRARNSQATCKYHRVVACTGFRFDDSMFDDSVRPDLVINRRFPNQTCCWESTNVRGLYFAGVLTQARDFKKTSSAFIHGFRYNARALHRILEVRNHGRPWPCADVGASVDEIARQIIERLNRSSALWLQFGFFGDVVVEPDAGSPGRFFEDVPVDFAHTSVLAGEQPYFLVTLEYGRSDFDPLRDDRVAHTDTEHAQDSTALHPVIRRYQCGQLLDEQHLIENLEAVWRDDDLHTEPLLRFLAKSGQTSAHAKSHEVAEVVRAFG